MRYAVVWWGGAYIPIKVGMELLDDDKVGEEGWEEADHKVPVEIKVAPSSENAPFVGRVAVVHAELEVELFVRPSAQQWLPSYHFQARHRLVSHICRWFGDQIEESRVLEPNGETGGPVIAAREEMADLSFFSSNTFSVVFKSDVEESKVHLEHEAGHLWKSR